MRQWQWLESFFRENKKSGEIKQSRFLDEMAKKLHAIFQISAIMSEHISSQLKFQKYPSAESALMCQLLVDLGTSHSTPTYGPFTYEKDDPLLPFIQQHLAGGLRGYGDYNGALTLFHSVPLAHIREKDLAEMTELVDDLCSRLKNSSKILGIHDYLVVLDRNIFDNMPPLVLPYSLWAERSNHWIDDEVFIKKSFIWPWIRMSVLKQLQDQPGASVNWGSTELDPVLRDAFGHTFLHAAILCQDNDRAMAIIENLQEPHHVHLRRHLVTQSPSYAPGLTPLACSACYASFLPAGSWGIFQAVLSLSDKYLCCARSDDGTITHEFCALGIAVRNRDLAVVNPLLGISIQQNVDIVNCCQWTMAGIPSNCMQPEVRDLVVEMLKQRMAGSKEDGYV